MARTELKHAPNFNLVRDESAATAIVADPAALTIANYPLADSFNPGMVDKIALYWDAKKDGAHLAAAGDTVNLELLIRNTHADEANWVVAVQITNLGWRQMAVVPVYQCSWCFVRKQAVTVADAAAKGFQVWAVKLIGPLNT